MDERDLRYQQRFEAQEVAVSAGLVAAEKAVSAALASAKEAVDKANAASDRRFEAVNEFRAQLADQAGSFVPRKEYEVQHAALTERLDTAVKTLGNKIDALSTDHAIDIGRRVGTEKASGYYLSVVPPLFFGLAGIVLTILYIVKK